MRAINEVTLEWLHSFFAEGLGSGGSLGWLFISPVGALMCSHVEYCRVLVCHPSWSTYGRGHYGWIICASGGGVSKMQMLFICTTISSDLGGEINWLRILPGWGLELVEFKSWYKRARQHHVAVPHSQALLDSMFGYWGNQRSDKHAFDIYIWPSAKRMDIASLSNQLLSISCFRNIFQKTMLSPAAAAQPTAICNI